jgi:hypothetical protein
MLALNYDFSVACLALIPHTLQPSLSDPSFFPSTSPSFYPIILRPQEAVAVAQQLLDQGIIVEAADEVSSPYNPTMM